MKDYFKFTIEKKFSKLVLKELQPNSYYGEIAHKKLNFLSEIINKEIIKICSSCNYIELVKILYIYYNMSCENVRDYSYMDGNYNEIVNVNSKPTIFRYLLECLIANKSLNEDIITEEELGYLIYCGSRLFQICNYSNLVYYNSQIHEYNGGFIVSDEGEILFDIKDEVKNTQLLFIKGLKNTLNLTRIKSNDNIEFNNNEITKDYDKLFFLKYGIKLTQIWDIVKYYFHSNETDVSLVSYNLLVKNLKRKLKYDKKTIKTMLNIFEIDPENIDNNAYYKFYNLPNSISRKPIIRISGKRGQNGLIFIGKEALLHAFVLLHTDVDRGLIDIGLPIEEMDRDKGPSFEEEVRKRIRDNDIDVISIKNTDSKTGDIDAIIFLSRSNKLLVLELKAPKLELSFNKMIHQINDSKKYFEQLTRKIEWVKCNTNLLNSKYNLKINNQTSIDGYIVTRMPISVEPSLVNNIIVEGELYDLLNIYQNSSKI